jgi:hypothetical protein
VGASVHKRTQEQLVNISIGVIVGSAIGVLAVIVRLTLLTTVGLL